MSPQYRHTSDSEIVEVFRESEDPFLTAPEVAESLSLTRQAINARLKNLHDDGVLERKEAGSHAVGWWLVDEN